MLAAVTKASSRQAKACALAFSGPLAAAHSSLQGTLAVSVRLSRPGMAGALTRLAFDRERKGRAPQAGFAGSAEDRFRLRN